MGVVGIFLVIALPLGLFALFGLTFLGPRDTIVTLVRYGTLIGLILGAALTVVQIGAILFGTTMQTTFNVAPTWPTLDILGLNIEDQTARIVSADELKATYTVAGLSFKVRTAYALSALFGNAITLYFLWIFHRLAKTYRAGHPFTGLAKHFTRSGALLFGFSLVAQGSAIAGNWMAGHETIAIGAFTYTGNDSGISSRTKAGEYPFPDWPIFESAGTLSLAPIAVALALVLVGRVFALGERFQQDTEGLV